MWGGDGTYNYVYSGEIKNTSNKNIVNWEVTFDTMEGAILATTTGTNAVITNGIVHCTQVDYNTTITPGNSATFQVQITMAIDNFEYSSLTLNGIEMDLSGEEIEPKALNFDISTLTMYMGNSQTILATVTPPNATYGTITWSSSDTSIATVSNTGTVSAISAGNTIITASLNGLSATCNVTVLVDQVVTDALLVELDKAGGWTSGSNYILQYNILLENLSTSDINGWSFELNLPAGSEITGGWGFEYTNVGNVFTITSGSTYSGHIAVGGKITSGIGLQLSVPSSTFVPIPTNVQVIQ